MLVLSSSPWEEKVFTSSSRPEPVQSVLYGSLTHPVPFLQRGERLALSGGGEEGAG